MLLGRELAHVRRAPAATQRHGLREQGRLAEDHAVRGAAGGRLQRRCGAPRVGRELGRELGRRALLARQDVHEAVGAVRDVARHDEGVLARRHGQLAQVGAARRIVDERQHGLGRRHDEGAQQRHGNEAKLQREGEGGSSWRRLSMSAARVGHGCPRWGGSRRLRTASECHTKAASRSVVKRQNGV